MKNTDTQFQLEEHFKRILNYSNFKLELLGNNISTKEKYDIANFKIKYNILQLENFQSEELINKCLQLSESIIDLKY